MIKLKNRAIALALAGAVLFTTAAAADFLAGDAYTGAKNAVKDTCAFLADGASSGTVEAGYNVLIDSDVIMTGAATNKYDFNAYRTETQSESTDENGTYKTWRYEDKECSVRYTAYEDTYYIYPYGLSEDYAIINNPFEEELTEDLEKVFDAFVGNLKEFVSGKDNGGDGVLYYGELDSTQVPALPNTLAAFVTKYTFNDDYNRERFGLPYLSEIAVDSVTGRMAVNEDGVIESAEGALSMVGYDEDGGEHTIRFEGYFKLYDINETEVSEFDRSGKTVVEEPDWTVEETSVSFNTFDGNDIGTYKKDIAELTDNGYEKVGCITLTIDEVDGDEVTGTYENSETGESAEFTTSRFYDDAYFFETDEGSYIITKRFDYSEEIPTGITLYSEATAEEYGWSAEGVPDILIRSFE